MRNIHDVLREKETKVQKLTLEVKVLRWTARLLEDESPSSPGQAAEARSPRATTAMINFEDGTVLPMSEDVSSDGPLSFARLRVYPDDPSSSTAH